MKIECSGFSEKSLCLEDNKVFLWEIVAVKVEAAGGEGRKSYEAAGGVEFGAGCGV